MGPDRDRHWQSIGERRRHIGSVREKMMRERRPTERLIDEVGRLLARPAFFLVLLAAHLAWIALNTGVVPGIEPWDPYPFIFLATLASVEAPFFALLILMRQARDRRVNELREEVNLQVSLHAEHEQTLMIRMLIAMARDLDVDLEHVEEVGDLEELRQGLDEARLVDALEQHLERTDDPAPGQKGE